MHSKKTKNGIDIMGKKISYTLKNRNKTFNTQSDYKKHLDDIREKYKIGKHYVEDEQDIKDLRDYLEDHYSLMHPENYSEIIENIDLQTCRFFVYDSKDYSENKGKPKTTRCIYIENKEGGYFQDFSIKKFTKPDSKAYLKQRLSYLVMNIKNDEKRRELSEINQENFGIHYILYHENPTWENIVTEFIKHEKLDNIDIGSILTKNTGKVNVPNFISEYQYLDSRFIEFYKTIEKTYRLEKKKSNQ